MKYAIITILISIGAASSAQAAGVRQIECSAFLGGYDVETILVDIGADGKAESVQYVDHQGPVGPFLKTSTNTFEYGPESLVINEVITIADDLRNATVVVVYKDGGRVAKTAHFTCE
ncbi:MAG: hypothetical protein A2X94_13930 [Bdellovibrionales bacterium GWB1_55_8]|nr:MAG: hypothetical protein A2X94_13930 [Bdellovibrionales bacterium GWB1_55_8]